MFIIGDREERWKERQRGESDGRRLRKRDIRETDGKRQRGKYNFFHSLLLQTALKYL
jgi:hypothetical protein